jgi:hypothetical protein
MSAMIVASCSCRCASDSAAHIICGLIDLALDRRDDLIFQQPAQ